jgi:uncharacterized protein (TIGR04255 family)
MTETEQFPAPPIVEALLDIQAVLPESVDQEHLAHFQDRLGKEYTFKQVRNIWTSELDLRGDSGPTARTSGGPVGWQFRSADGRRVAQARKNGFSLSCLKPYQGWTSLSNEARMLWSKYVELVKPEKVTRIALRYINRVELPLPFEDFSEYVLTGPELAPNIPQAMSSFFCRVVLPDQATRSVAIVTTTIEENEEKRTGKLPLIFDIDVFRQGSFPLDAGKLWPSFEQLHELKNRIFFNSFTDKAKELFR